MIKYLTKHGNSLALIIDRGILGLLHMDKDTLVSLSTDGKSLFIRPVSKRSRRNKRDQKSR